MARSRRSAVAPLVAAHQQRHGQLRHARDFLQAAESPPPLQMTEPRAAQAQLAVGTDLWRAATYSRRGAARAPSSTASTMLDASTFVSSSNALPPQLSTHASCAACQRGMSSTPAASRKSSTRGRSPAASAARARRSLSRGLPLGITSILLEGASPAARIEGSGAAAFSPPAAPL